MKLDDIDTIIIGPENMCWHENTDCMKTFVEMKGKWLERVLTSRGWLFLDDVHEHFCDYSKRNGKDIAEYSRCYWKSNREKFEIRLSETLPSATGPIYIVQVKGFTLYNPGHVF